MDTNLRIELELFKINLRAADTVVQEAEEAAGKYLTAKSDLDQARRVAKKLKNPFYDPFWLISGDFFESVNETAFTCICSILLFNLGIFIYMFVGVCYVVNAISFLLYLLLCPIVLPIRVLAGKGKVRSLERRVAALEREAAKCDPRDARAVRQDLLNRMKREQPDVMRAFEEEQAKAAEDDSYASDGLRQTDYYKQQCEKYYNIYMGIVPQSSSADAYDQLLLDWAYAKGSGLFNDTNW